MQAKEKQDAENARIAREKKAAEEARVAKEKQAEDARLAKEGMEQAKNQVPKKINVVATAVVRKEIIAVATV